MKTPKIVVHADVVLDHLLHGEKGPSILRIAMKKYLCYTTVVNAMELFSYGTSGRYIGIIQDALGAMKILGVNSRNAKNFGLLMRRYPRCTMTDLLVAGICLESNLPLLTIARERFSGIKRLNLVEPASLG